MNYKETFFFIGRCLGLSLYPEREDEIRKTLNSGEVSWDLLLLVSSNYFVLPALYVQFRNYNLLDQFPNDYVEELEKIHWLNVERNEAIQQQSVEIIEALNSIEIAPIFLKGAAHIFDNLYGDIGERMMGDIDFLVAENEIQPAVEKLKELGYASESYFNENLLSKMKHYPRLLNYNVAAAVEVHRQPVSEPYDKRFNYALINPKKKRLDVEGEAYVLSDKHQIVHNVMNAQMNDKTFKTRRIYLRNLYDLFLLSRREDPLKTSIQFEHYPTQFGAYLMVASKVLGSPNQLRIPKHKKVHRYFKQLMFLNDNPRTHKIFLLAQYFVLRMYRYISLPIQAIFDKDERQALIWRLSHKEWYLQHLKSWRNIKI